MPLYIVRVSSVLLDSHNLEGAQIADSYVPVEAGDDADACRRAVLWHGDNGTAIEDEDLLWRCDDKGRGLSFKATKCLPVTEDDMSFFLSVTQGLSMATVIGRSTTR